MRGTICAEVGQVGRRWHHASIAEIFGCSLRRQRRQRLWRLRLVGVRHRRRSNWGEWWQRHHFAFRAGSAPLENEGGQELVGVARLYADKLLHGIGEELLDVVVVEVPLRSVLPFAGAGAATGFDLWQRFPGTSRNREADGEVAEAGEVAWHVYVLHIRAFQHDRRVPDALEHLDTAPSVNALVGRRETEDPGVGEARLLLEVPDAQ
mmetsp:Transcript_15545/g.44222  ORF Transcript_15545/g.44222 Transcript_15545/m.44222 type:complete len:207 (+) Transcript_15545:360-980(+)